MTNSAFPHQTAAQPVLDTGPLSWVIVEIREALARSHTALLAAGGRTPDDQATQLQLARTHLHQAHGALQMLDLDGVSEVTALAERALERFKSGAIRYSTDHVEAVSRLYQALVRYLEELLAGAPSQPARLYPYYRDVQQLTGSERIHPADLFFPDLERVVPSPDPAAAPEAAAADYGAYRQRFERALLPYLKSTEPAQQREHAVALRDAVTAVASAQRDARVRTFWLAMQAFAELVASGALPAGVQVKQLLGLINLQIRRLGQGEPALPGAMLRDALFFIAVAGDEHAGKPDGAEAAPDAPSVQDADASPLQDADAAPTARLLRAVFALDGLAPADYETRRYEPAPASAPWPAQGPMQWPAQWPDAAPAAAVTQVKAALRQTEQALDAYHADPHAAAVLSALAQLAPVLGGLQAQLAALDQQDARRAAEQVAAQVSALHAGAAGHAAAGTPAELSAVPAILDAVAQNVGALGFFADMLAQNAAGARERFAFDARQGSFRAIPFRKLAGADTIPVLDDAVPAAPVAMPQAPDPASGMAGGLARGLVAADSGTAEWLAIFIAEAREVLDGVDAMLADRCGASAEEGEDARLTLLRRSFHTLQGSARMVAQLPFAQAAQAVCQVLNTWQAEARPADDALYDVLALSARTLRAWVDELAETGSSGHGADALVAASARLLELPGGADVAEFVDSADVTDVAEHADSADVAERANVIDVTDATELADSAGSTDTAAAPSSPGDPAIAPALRAIYAQEAAALIAQLANDIDAWRRLPRSAVGAATLKAVHTLAGASGTVGATPLHALARTFESVLAALQAPAPALDPAQFDLLDFTVERLRQMLDSFAAGAAPSAQPELIAALEALRVQLQATAPAASPAIEARLDELVAGTVGQLQGQPAAPAPAQAPLPLDRLFTDAYAALSGSGAPAPAVALPADAAAPADEQLFAAAYAALSGSSAPAPAVAPPADAPAPAPAPAATRRAPQDDLPDQAGRQAQPLSASLEQLFADAYAALSASAPVSGVPQAPGKPAWKAAHRDDAIDELFNAAFDDAFAAPPRDIAAPPSSSSSSSPPAPLTADAVAAPGQAAVETGILLTDALDPELLPVFLEEGADLLPQVGEALRAWQHAPDDHAPAHGLLRTLHTVKGSARMAGAMRLGQHVHEIETHVAELLHADAGQASPQAFDELLAHYDHALQLFEQLQQPSARAATVGAPAPAIGADAPGNPAGAAGTAAQPDDRDAGTDDAPAGARSPLVRVRADILDRLVNQAGEVSIARSRLENEVGAMRSALAEVSDNLARLRRQLREIEVQAESQIASRMAIASTVEFDPLEFDRYTRLQELTRMMAESVNDAATLHETLARSADHAGDDLVLQARLTRELQRDLMRVRMVPFASISERLYRVARQSAKEVDKRVSLDIRGGDVEIDRSVLERMAAPFEHLLRNAIAHGIETRAGRAQAGKNETGELLVQASQQGNEVVIAFADDGAGLDLARIRATAQASGLLRADEEASDEQVADLIFEPGFTTARALTELSGRGMGMDIVQSEAQALGGRVDLESTPGHGARFTIRLPLTLAVTQVVLVVAGARSYALPSILVEQVLQLKEPALAAAHAQGHVTVHEQQAALHYLPVLLGEVSEPAQAAATVKARSAPVLMLKNGNERLALQVDEVLGNREVVVKNIGPQLARLAGIAGATVLGSGDIVLILNPVVLVQHLAQQPEARRQYAQAATGGHGGTAALQPQARTVMVVDDSMTVRRVTQRLLEREGYRVLLAKDGVDALEQLREVRPDLMLVDIEMPRMDGFDLTRNVRSDARTRDIPLIMITSRSADRHRQLALELGVNAFFGKPFPEPELLATMRSLLAQDGIAAP